MREEEEAVVRFNERIEKIRRRMLDPDELAGAVEAFDPLWDALSPTDKARLVHLLVDRIEYDGEVEAISITFHPTGISTLAEQPQETEACQPA
jgi:site-specific DNA recombinase